MDFLWKKNILEAKVIMQGRNKEMRGIWKHCGRQCLIRALPEASLSTEKLMFSRISPANAEEYYSLENQEEYNKCPA